jgi:hypothetical protein
MGSLPEPAGNIRRVYAIVRWYTGAMPEHFAVSSCLHYIPD